MLNGNQSAGAGSSLVVAADRPEIHFGGAGARDYLLTPPWNRRIQVIQSTAPPGSRSGQDPYPTPSDAQFVHVTRGELEITPCR